MASLIYTHKHGQRAGQSIEHFFDEEDRDLAERSHAAYHKSGKPQKMQLRVRDKTVGIHREIAKRVGIDAAALVDHVDGNPFNNLRENLRANSKRGNCRNTNARGVIFDRRRNRWRAKVSVSTCHRDPSDIVNITADKLYTLALGKNVSLIKAPSGKVCFKMGFEGKRRVTRVEAEADYADLKKKYHDGEIGYGRRSA